MNIKSVIIALFCMILSWPACSEGLLLGSTRLIYNADKKEASVGLSNRGSGGPYLVQSWVSTIERKTDGLPFITTPPLYKLGVNEDSLVRVVYIGNGTAIPQDRESVFLLNVRAIPAVKKEADPKRLIVATQNIIKLIYRPAVLKAEDANKAVNHITATYANGNIVFDNPTPYVVTLAGLTVGNQKIKRPGYILPFGKLNVPAKNRPANLTFSAINDFGGLTESRRINF